MCHTRGVEAWRLREPWFSRTMRDQQVNSVTGRYQASGSGVRKRFRASMSHRIDLGTAPICEQETKIQVIRQRIRAVWNFAVYLKKPGSMAVVPNLEVEGLRHTAEYQSSTPTRVQDAVGMYQVRSESGRRPSSKQKKPIGSILGRALVLPDLFRPAYGHQPAPNLDT